MTAQCVQVKLELGHKAAIRKKPTQEGFTHDWSVFVRGPEGSNIQHFIEKVVFHLHDSFPKPKRSVKEPPYQISESGYAGFTLPVEVWFRTKEEPKRVKFDYDLFLHLEGPPVNNVRCEKLTFRNPASDFKEKLLRAGGVLVARPDGIAANQPQNVEVSQTLQPPIDISTLAPSMNSLSSAPPSIEPANVEKSQSEPQENKVKSRPSSSASSTTESHKKQKSSSGKHHKHDKSHPSSKSSSQTSKSSSESTKAKSSPSIVKKHKDKEELKKKFCIAAFVKSPKEEKDVSRSVSSTTQKEPKVHREKVASKSPASMLSSSSSSSKSSTNPAKQSEEAKPAEKHSSSSKSEKKKSSTKSSSSKDSKESRVKETSKTTKHETVSSKSKESKENRVKVNVKESKTVKDENSEKPSSKESKESRVKETSKIPKEEKKVEQKEKDKQDVKKKPKPTEHASRSKGESSSKERVKDGSKDRSDSIKHEGKDGNVEKKVKASSKHKSNVTFSKSESQTIPKNAESATNGRAKSPSLPKEKPSPSESRKSPVVLPSNSSKQSSSATTNGESLKTIELTELQNKIMQSRERKLIQKIVDLIEETGKYKVREKTFDFDLCSLDKETLKKLKMLVGGSS